MRDWGRRHSSIVLLIAFAVVGWLIWWEAARIEGAQRTVARGWGTGLAVGILASAGLTALWVVLILDTRRRRRSRQWPQWLLATRARPGSSLWPHWVLAVIVLVSFGICVSSTMPSRSPGASPYIITTGIGVGEIAYVATYSAQLMALFAWMAVRLYRLAGAPPIGESSGSRRPGA